MSVICLLSTKTFLRSPFQGGQSAAGCSAHLFCTRRCLSSEPTCSPVHRYRESSATMKALSSLIADVLATPTLQAVHTRRAERSATGCSRQVHEETPRPWRPIRQPPQAFATGYQIEPQRGTGRYRPRTCDLTGVIRTL